MEPYMTLLDSEYLEMVGDTASVVIIDLESGKIEFVTSKIEAMFGVSVKNGLYGEPVERLLPERFREKHVAYRGEMLVDPKPRAMGFRGRQLYGLTETGEEFPVAIGLEFVKSRDGRVKGIASIVDMRGLQVHEGDSGIH